MFGAAFLKFGSGTAVWKNASASHETATQVRRSDDSRRRLIGSRMRLLRCHRLPCLDRRHRDAMERRPRYRADSRASASRGLGFRAQSRARTSRSLRPPISERSVRCSLLLARRAQNISRADDYSQSQTCRIAHRFDRATELKCDGISFDGLSF